MKVILALGALFSIILLLKGTSSRSATALEKYHINAYDCSEGIFHILNSELLRFISFFVSN